MADTYDVLVLGAGPSGLLAAAEAGARGLRVLVLERGREPGGKLLLAGGGKANFTNRSVSVADYVGRDPAFAAPALAALAPEAVLERLRGAGVRVEERGHGQMFCRDSARPLLDLLLRRCGETGCALRLNSPAESVDRLPDGSFRLNAATGSFRAASLVLATGSPAWPQCGADDAGLRLARSLGHRIVPPRPVLAPLVMPQEWPLHGLAGVSAEVRIRCDAPGSPAYRLPLLFTHKGVSGPAALQISCFLRGRDALELDFLPGKDFSVLLDASENGKLTPCALLSRHLPERLARALLPAELGGRKNAELSRKDRTRLHNAVHAHRVTPLRTEGMRRAEAAAGGVDTGEVDRETLQSRLFSGLFFCGEILDITGRLGGYNLHWAWASAFVAGNAVHALVPDNN